jgi:hypothetical protein
MVPIHKYEVQDLYYQMRYLLKHKGMGEQILKPIAVREPMLANMDVQPEGIEEILNSFTRIERVS